MGRSELAEVAKRLRGREEGVREFMRGDLGFKN